MTLSSGLCSSRLIGPWYGGSGEKGEGGYQLKIPNHIFSSLSSLVSARRRPERRRQFGGPRRHRFVVDGFGKVIHGGGRDGLGDGLLVGVICGLDAPPPSRRGRAPPRGRGRSGDAVPADEPPQEARSLHTSSGGAKNEYPIPPLFSRVRVDVSHANKAIDEGD